MVGLGLNVEYFFDLHSFLVEIPPVILATFTQWECISCQMYPAHRI